jgi:hypothetical protein
MTNVPTIIPPVEQVRAMQSLASVRKERERLDEKMKAIQRTDDHCARAIVGAAHDGYNVANCYQISQSFQSDLKAKGFGISTWTSDCNVYDTTSNDPPEITGTQVEW